MACIIFNDPAERSDMNHPFPWRTIILMLLKGKGIKPDIIDRRIVLFQPEKIQYVQVNESSHGIRTISGFENSEFRWIGTALRNKDFLKNDFLEVKYQPQTSPLVDIQV
jgi:hypothetical protein